jgi:glycyl-tRNA synthetase
MPDAPASIDNASKSMTDIMALCKRRGFIFPASEIYGGVNGFWDYGPQGAQLKKNLRDAWWNDCVTNPPIGPDGDEVSIVGLDSCIIQNPKVWEASGHVGGFSDPMQTCRQCKKLLRADHVWELLRESEWVKSFADAFEDSDDPELIKFRSDAAMEWARKKGKKLAPGLALVRNPSVTLSWLAEDLESSTDSMLGVTTLLQYIATEQKAKTGLITPCPHCGGDLTEPRAFNLMFKTYLGATATEEDVAYLRPETAQGIFINYKNVLDSTRVKIPFGIAQTGKAFRNEVTPRNFTFRSREFEQMEIEFFCHADDSRMWYEFWRDWRMQWWESLGLAGANLLLREHDTDELAHYAKTGAGTSDIEYKFPFTAPGFGELEGVADRSNFDLKQHAEHGNVKLEYFDQDRNERYLPNVIEPSAGLDRGVLALLCEAYTPDPERPSKVFMRFDPRIAPTKAAVFPLVNKDGMPELGKKLQTALRKRFGAVEFDAKQSIGKRYARMDEVGCPFCFTIDGESLTEQTVTVRDRDTLAQERIAIDKVEGYLAEKLGVG